jgi:hypothetical protein
MIRDKTLQKIENIVNFFLTTGFLIERRTIFAPAAPERRSYFLFSRLKQPKEKLAASR